uniref:F-box domain-containing protein n=1 Tax=Leersia perrieri TaxID=77586 RepID=A0A0D9UWY8_9ORYZ
MERDARARQHRRRQEYSSSDHRIGGNDDDDLISHLNDDVLLHILRSLPTLTDVVRACAVSRRWRHLEACVPVLRFACLNRHDFEWPDELDRFVAGVNNVLARRASASQSQHVPVEELAITVKSSLVCRCTSVPSVHVDQVNAWIRHGMQHVSKSFALKLVNLPLSSATLETMVFSLSNACFRLSATATFDSLVDLSLEKVRLRLEEDGSRLLSQACCPRLRKLCLHRVNVDKVVDPLHIESNELLELSLDDITCGHTLLLEIKTPKLRVLHMSTMYIRRLAIYAPRLEEFTFFTWVTNVIDVEDMSCVQILKIALGSSLITNISRHKSSRPLRFLTLRLDISQKDSHRDTELASVKDIPHLHQVTSLTLQVSGSGSQEVFYYFASVACLLTRCKFLKYLELNITYFSTFTVVKKKQRRRHLSDHGSGNGDDLISHLDDDVLLHVFRFLPSLTDIVRASAVSRRWRHLGARVPSLIFTLRRSEIDRREKLDQFIVVINNTLAKHVGQFEDLTISLQSYGFRTAANKCDVPSVDVAQVGAWIRHGMQHVMKSFTLVLDPLLLKSGDNHSPHLLDNRNMVLDELPSSTRLETMVLSLSNACLRLPVAATFHSLTDLSLMNIRLEKDSTRHLNHLLSSACCPRLRKLCLKNLMVDRVVDRLLVESNELLELSFRAFGKYSMFLELKTPCLRVLDMAYVSLKRLSIAAPRLEEFTFSNTTVSSTTNFEDMPCARVVMIDLRPILEPGYGERLNQARFQVLQCCRFLQFLTLHLYIFEKNDHDFVEVDVMKYIPQLPHVTSLSLHVFEFNKVLYDIANVACLLTRCKFLKHFELNILSSIGYQESTYQNQMDHHIISLEYLQEIKIISDDMRDYEARLIKLLHASAPPLKKMRVALKPAITMSSQILGMHPKIICEEFLHSIALDKEGKWEFCNHDAKMQDFTSFEWTPIENNELSIRTESNQTSNKHQKSPHQPISQEGEQPAQLVAAGPGSGLDGTAQTDQLRTPRKSIDQTIVSDDMNR